MELRFHIYAQGQRLTTSQTLGLSEPNHHNEQQNSSEVAQFLVTNRKINERN